MKTVISERGQITVPKEVRDQLALAPGTELEVAVVRGGFIARKRLSRSAWRDALGVLARSGNSDAIVFGLARQRGRDRREVITGLFPAPRARRPERDVGGPAA
jgi:AbrB family looped-hinge helix DNA binding protein